MYTIKKPAWKPCPKSSLEKFGFGNETQFFRTWAIWLAYLVENLAWETSSQPCSGTQVGCVSDLCVSFPREPGPEYAKTGKRKTWHSAVTRRSVDTKTRKRENRRVLVMVFLFWGFLVFAFSCFLRGSGKSNVSTQTTWASAGQRSPREGEKKTQTRKPGKPRKRENAETGKTTKTRKREKRENFWWSQEKKEKRNEEGPGNEDKKQHSPP